MCDYSQTPPPCHVTGGAHGHKKSFHPPLVIEQTARIRDPDWEAHAKKAAKSTAKRPGTPQGPGGRAGPPWPRAMIHEPWAMSHEPDIID